MAPPSFDALLATGMSEERALYWTQEFVAATSGCLRQRTDYYVAELAVAASQTRFHAALLSRQAASAGVYIDSERRARAAVHLGMVRSSPRSSAAPSASVSGSRAPSPSGNESGPSGVVGVGSAV
jgi:hypothetical protein